MDQTPVLVDPADGPSRRWRRSTPNDRRTAQPKVRLLLLEGDLTTHNLVDHHGVGKDVHLEVTVVTGTRRRNQRHSRSDSPFMSWCFGQL